MLEIAIVHREQVNYRPQLCDGPAHELGENEVGVLMEGYADCMITNRLHRAETTHQKPQEESKAKYHDSVADHSSVLPQLNEHLRVNLSNK